MTVIIKSIEQHGKDRWVRTNCPDCGSRVFVRTHLSESNEKTATCDECGAQFTVAWEETDESLV